MNQLCELLQKFGPLAARILLAQLFIISGIGKIGGFAGTAGFIAIDHAADLLTATLDAAAFLAVESCGQCTPCKADGRTIATGLGALVVADASEIRPDLDTVRAALTTVADGARCNLASQQQAVVGTILDRFPEMIADVADRTRAPRTNVVIAPITDLVGGRFVLDTPPAATQPDRTFADRHSGTAPADCPRQPAHTPPPPTSPPHPRLHPPSPPRSPSGRRFRMSRPGGRSPTSGDSYSKGQSPGHQRRRFGSATRLCH